MGTYRQGFSIKPGNVPALFIKGAIGTGNTDFYLTKNIRKSYAGIFKFARFLTRGIPIVFGEYLGIFYSEFICFSAGNRLEILSVVERIFETFKYNDTIRSPCECPLHHQTASAITGNGTISGK